MSEKRVAVIDCGTNTFNLLIAEKAHEKWRFLCRRKKVVKLGSQGVNKRIIEPIPTQKALKAMRDYRELIKKFHVEKVQVVGTAALRDAKNGEDLIRLIKKESGFDIRLIDGNEEARLIYEGVKSAFPMDEKTSLIMDIGGGSTEFILCLKDQIIWKRSFRLGAARLLEHLHPSDPIRKSEIQQLELFLEKQLMPLMTACHKYKPVRLIGSSGSFDTFASLILRKENRILGKKHHYTFELKQYRKLHKKLISSTYSERLVMPGMLKMRADMISLASLLLSFVLDNTGINDLHLCTFSLKEGVLQEFCQGNY